MLSIVYHLGERLYLNITNRCSNDCRFCLRKFRNGIGRFRLKLTEDPSASEIIQELEDIINRRSWRETVFCGFGEPMERLHELLETTKWIKKYHSIPVRIDTNGHGYLLNPGIEVVKELKEAGVDKLSVSVNADSADLYDRICRPLFADAFASVLEFVKKSRERLETEITVVTIPEVDLSRMRELARGLNVQLRIRPYLPLTD